MKKIFKKNIFSICFALLLVSVSFVYVNAGSYTTNVDLVKEKETRTLWDGVTLDHKVVSSKRLGAYSADANVYSWDTIAISAENNPAIRIVTWGMDTLMNGKDYRAGTTMDIAKNYEQQHPGYKVIAGVNGDFFANRGFTTSAGKNVASATNEPLNTFIADGEAFKSVVMANPDHAVIGFREDRTYTYHIGTIYGKNNEVIYFDDYYAGTGVNRGDNAPTFSENPYFTINELKMEANVYRQTKTLDPNGVNIFWYGVFDDVDVTGYTVWVGTVDRKSVPNDGFNKTFIGRHPSDETQHAMEYNLDYTHYYLRGRLMQQEDITTISSVDENRFYVVTKNQDVINELDRKTEVKVQYELTGDWADVTSTMGVIFPFLINGERTGYVAETGSPNAVMSNYLTENKPKPAIGFKADGTCVFFFMGPGSYSGVTQGGPSGVEMTEVMEKMGLVDAFCLDGGGSASIIAIDENGDLKELNTPTDPGGTRSVANAILMVVEESNLELESSTATTATFHQSAPMADSTLTSANVVINNQSYELVEGSVTVNNLKPNTKYEYYFEYTYELDGIIRSTKTNVETFTTTNEDVTEHDHIFVDGECECGEIDPNYQEHIHEFVHGECSCGEVDPNYQEHIHEFVDGECSCGEKDPDYEEHEHKFVNGKCECGENDPNYNPPTQSSGCSMGTALLMPLLLLAVIIFIKKDN